jgi:hypothetical protein
VTSLFAVFAAVGGALLALQLLMGLIGASDFHFGDFGGADAEHADDIHASDALNLLSARALINGALFFGLTGLAVTQLRAGVLALPAALVVGLGVATLTAWVMRAMARMDTDGAERLESAVGQSATVYLGIPGDRTGRGKIHLTLAGKLVECQAQSEQPLATGASVLVIDVIGPDVVEVIPSPQFGA